MSHLEKYCPQWMKDQSLTLTGCVTKFIVTFVPFVLAVDDWLLCGSYLLICGSGASSPRLTWNVIEFVGRCCYYFL